MSLIEGIGDEVTVVFALLAILVVGLLAWFSTHTSDIPFFSVIVVELSQRANRNRNRNTAAGETRTENAEPNVNNESVPEDNRRSISDVVSSALDNVNEALGLDRDILDLDEDTENEDEDEDEDDEASEVVTADAVEPTAADGQTTSADDCTTSTPLPEKEAGSSISESENVTGDELRRRRVAFFENAQNADPSCISETQSKNAECLNSQSEGSIKSSDEITKDSSGGNQNSSDNSQNSPDNSQNSRNNSQNSPDNSQNSSDNSQNSPDNLQNSQDNILEDENQIRVRLKYLNDTQRLVLARPLDTIGYFKRTHFSEELSQQKLVRLIYNGQDLRNETSTLQSCNVVDNSVLHCLITQNIQPEQTLNYDIDDDVNIGNFMIPIFGLLLGALWYLRFNYKQYFNATSTLSLAGISFLFLFAAFTSLRPQNAQGGNRHLD